MKVKSSIICCLLLLPMIGWGQSEVTQRVSAAEMGYKGRVKTVQSTEFCMDSAHRYFVTTAEAYNEAGFRTDISIIEDIYQTNYHYEYDANGQLVYYVATYSEGGKDSIVFHYGKDGCLFGYEEYFLSYDPTEGNSVTDFLVTCDAQCRPLMAASVWEDTTTFVYDGLGRVVAKTAPTVYAPHVTWTYYYDEQGRLAKVRTGDKNYEDTHYRYNEQGDTLEVWHTNWEHWEGDEGAHEIGEHKHFNYTAYDDHGNWTNATVTARKHTYFIARTFRYYE
ncbi:MAG: RHS repeat protein [Bacteroidales bacterium]|nr:RHS repeat protein [Bacteroidales bacterium]